MEKIWQNPMVLVSKADLDAMISGCAEAKAPAPVKELSLDTSIKGESIATHMCNGVRYISRLETAKLLGVDVSTLWLWNKKGILKSIKVGSRKVQYMYDDVVRVMHGDCMVKYKARG